MSEFVRPPADIAKLRAAWSAWSEGSELPGRTMSDLKIAGLDLLLSQARDAAVGDTGTGDTQAGDVAAMLAALDSWEAGAVGPADTLNALDNAGLVGLVATLPA